MTKQITIIALLVAFVTVEANAQNRTYRRRGVIMGGLAGAALGAIIGDKGNNETAGALIGGAVGAVAGGTIGNQKDQRIEHNYRYNSGYSQQVHPRSGYRYGPYPQHHRSYYQPQVHAYPPRAHAYPPRAPAVSPAHPVSQAVAPQDVVAMVRGRLSESMIIQQIQLRGIDHQLSVAEVIQMHEMGVSERIITQMQVAAPTEPTKEVLPVPMQSYRLPPPPSETYGPTLLGPDSDKE